MQAELESYLPSRKVQERYRISDVTLWRWERAENSAFPKPVRINGRKFWAVSALVEYERSLASPHAAGAV